MFIRDQILPVSQAKKADLRGLLGLTGLRHVKLDWPSGLVALKKEVEKVHGFSFRIRWSQFLHHLKPLALDLG